MSNMGCLKAIERFMEGLTLSLFFVVIETTIIMKIYGGKFTWVILIRFSSGRVFASQGHDSFKDYLQLRGRVNRL